MLFKLKLNKAKADYARQVRGNFSPLDFEQYDWLEVLAITPRALIRSYYPDDDLEYLDYWQHEWVIRSPDGRIHRKPGYILENMMDVDVWVGWDVGEEVLKKQVADLALNPPPEEASDTELGANVRAFESYKRQHRLKATRLSDTSSKAAEKLSTQSDSPTDEGQAPS